MLKFEDKQVQEMAFHLSGKIWQVQQQIGEGRTMFLAAALCPIYVGTSVTFDFFQKLCLLSDKAKKWRILAGHHEALYFHAVFEIERNPAEIFN